MSLFPKQKWSVPLNEHSTLNQNLGQIWKNPNVGFKF